MAPNTDTYHLKLTFFLSLTAVPIVYLFNLLFESLDKNDRPFWMMLTGFVLLGGIGSIAYFASKIRDAIYFGITVFAFTCVIDATISLEYFGFAESFMSEYLKIGEPYLFSPWGAAICTFDATFYYIMYLVIVYLYSNQKSWRSVGLYWGTSLSRGLFVMLSAIFAGKHSPTFCTLLNIPYLLFPIYVLFRLFKTQKRCAWNVKIKRGVFLVLLDILIAMGFLASIWIISAKAYTLLGSKSQLILDTVKHERGLGYNDPAPFNTIQVLATYFHTVPIQILSLYFLTRQEKPQFLWEVTIAQAAATLEPQFSYILSSFDSHTPAEYRVQWTNLQFWIPNLLIILVPHIFLVRLYLHRVNVAPKGKKYK